MAARFNVPPVTRILLIVLIAQFALYTTVGQRQRSSSSGSSSPDSSSPDSSTTTTKPHTDDLKAYLALIPQLALFHPWTFLSAALLEPNLVGLGVGAVAIFAAGRYLERAWSGRELARFVAIVAVVSNLFAVAVCLLAFALGGDGLWMCVFFSLSSISPFGRLRFLSVVLCRLHQTNVADSRRCSARQVCRPASSLLSHSCSPLTA